MRGKKNHGESVISLQGKVDVRKDKGVVGFTEFLQVLEPRSPLFLLHSSLPFYNQHSCATELNGGKS